MRLATLYNRKMGFRRRSNCVDYRQVKKVELDGRSFDSKAESQLYLYLKALEQSGEVKNIRCQVTLDLLPPLGRKRMQYRADFVVFDVQMGCDIVCEQKGYESPSWVEKLRVYRFTGPMPMRLYKAGWNTFSLLEEVYPEPAKLISWLQSRPGGESSLV